MNPTKLTETIQNTVVPFNKENEKTKDLFSAFVLAQAEIGVAIKENTNPFFRSKYADLASVVSAIKPHLAKHGLGFVQKFHNAEGGVCIETIIIHRSGESMSTGLLFLPASKNDAQSYGSAITYCRRYSLQTAFGVPADDDDGNAVVSHALTTTATRHVEVVRDVITDDQVRLLERKIKESDIPMEFVLDRIKKTWNINTLRDLNNAQLATLLERIRQNIG